MQAPRFPREIAGPDTSMARDRFVVFKLVLKYIYGICVYTYIYIQDICLLARILYTYIYIYIYIYVSIAPVLCECIAVVKS